MRSFSVSAFVAGLAVLATPLAFASGLDKSSCTFNGKPLYGKVQEVSSFPDVKVQVVSSFGDLKVQEVSSFADNCGEWQVVTSFPDVKIQYVDSFPDVKIEKVSSFPGMR